MKERTEFYKRLTGRKVWIPCAKNQDGGITLELLRNGKGEQYIPAFYSKESVMGNFHREKLVQIEFLTLRHVLLELPREVCGIVIEPFGENMLLDRKKLMEFDASTQGMSVNVHSHEDGLTLMAAGQLPSGLKRALQNFFAGEMGVNCAWILLAKGKAEKFPHLLVAVDFYGSKIQLFPKLAEVMKPFMKPSQQFELMEKTPFIDEKKFEKAVVYRRRKNPQ